MTQKEYAYKSKLIAEAHLKKPQQKDDPTLTWQQRYTAYRATKGIQVITQTIYNLGTSFEDLIKTIGEFTICIQQERPLYDARYWESRKED